MWSSTSGAGSLKKANGETKLFDHVARSKTQGKWLPHIWFAGLSNNSLFDHFPGQPARVIIQSLYRHVLPCAQAPPSPPLVAIGRLKMIPAKEEKKRAPNKSMRLLASMKKIDWLRYLEQHPSQLSPCLHPAPFCARFCFSTKLVVTVLSGHKRNQTIQNQIHSPKKSKPALQSHFIVQAVTRQDPRSDLGTTQHPRTWKICA